MRNKKFASLEQTLKRKRERRKTSPSNEAQFRQGQKKTRAEGVRKYKREGKAQREKMRGRERERREEG